jgi:hypothetical protein
MSRQVALASLFLAACGAGNHGDDNGTVDAGDMAGLVFQISSPDLGQIDQDTTVEHLRMHARDVRALGDAAPGDDRTLLDHTDIDLDTGAVRTIQFDKAPPGRYSSFELVVDRPSDSDYAWQMDGTTVVDGNNWNFEIEDDQAQPITLPIDVTLDAGQTATIQVHVLVNPICEPIDWSQALPDGSTLEINDASPQAAGARMRFSTSFSIAGVQLSYAHRATTAQSMLALGP